MWGFLFGSVGRAELQNQSWIDLQTHGVPNSSAFLWWILSLSRLEGPPHQGKLQCLAVFWVLTSALFKSRQNRFYPFSFCSLWILSGCIYFYFLFKCTVQPDIASFFYYFRFLICHLWFLPFENILYFFKLICAYIWVSVVVDGKILYFNRKTTDRFIFSYLGLSHEDLA